MEKTTSKFLTNYYSIKKYNDDYYKLVFHKRPVKAPGFELDSSLKVNRDVNRDKLSNNLVRAKNKVFEYAMCNEFDYFVTFTLNKEKYDRYNLPKFIKDLGQFIRDYRKKYSVDFQYLLIPEEHKDGAWHMHGLVKGIVENQLIINKNGYMDWPLYSDKFGWISIDSIRSREATAKYITKYITKSVYLGKGVTEKNKKLYYASRGLEVSEKIKEGSLTVRQLDEITFNFENDYVYIKDMNGFDYLKFSHLLDI